MKRKKFFISTFIFISLLIFCVQYCNNKVIASGEGKIYKDVSEIPNNHVGLLLGTGKYLRNGKLNPYYVNRIKAATDLMQAYKIDYLIISGDNSRIDYNEPAMMRADLIKEGIDSNCIYLDYAGFRTFDSMVRLREIFGQESATIISQEFHNQRALYIAQKENLNAIAFNAKDVPSHIDLKTKNREKLARVKVFVDYIVGVKPKFLGPRVEVPES